MTDGIHIPRDLADAEGVPEDLDAGLVGPYRFPDPRRRRIAGWMYAAGGAALAWPGFTVDSGYLVVAVLLALLATWHLAAAWPLVFDQGRALSAAAGSLPFAAGHASAAITFAGLRARPRWQVIAYSPEEPPSRRALVEIDAVDGAVNGVPYVEDVPEV